MKLHTVGRHHLVEGDCVEVLRAMPDSCFDACVSDPPYGLGFMGKAWDCDVPGPAFAAELFRVLKPGAHACLFGGTRTFHRLAVALEDAGFEIRDCLSWLYGTGFPKSLDVSKAIDAAAGATREVIGPSPYAGRASSTDFGIINDDAWQGGGARDLTAPATPEAARWNGWGTALKPAWEPVLLVRKPLIGTVAANVLEHGTGGLNIDATRIAGPKPDTTRGAGGANGCYSPIAPQGRIADDGKGRWPANVVLDEVAAELLDAQTGERRSAGNYPSASNVGGMFRDEGSQGRLYSDTGGASRFFYVAKPSRAERDRGCEALPVRSGGEATDREDDAPGTQSPRASASRTGGARNIHPTVKPAALIRWLVQLVTPPGGVVLDPFAGSGTIFLAAEGLDVTVNAIERDPEYVQIAIARGSSAK